MLAPRVESGRDEEAYRAPWTRLEADRHFLLVAATRSGYHDDPGDPSRPQHARSMGSATSAESAPSLSVMDRLVAEEEATRFSRAFPSHLRSEVAEVLAIIPRPDLVTSRTFTAIVGHEVIEIPERVYNPEVGDSLRMSLGDTRQRILDGFYSRHHNGYVRERSIARLLAADETQSWAVPYVVRLLGEYVVEIVQTIDAALVLTPDGAQATVYGQFAAANLDFMRLTEARATSYWACYYRDQYPIRRPNADSVFPTYPAFLAIERIGNATRSTPRWRSVQSVHTIADDEYNFGTSGRGAVGLRVEALQRANSRFRSIGHTADAAWCVLDIGIIRATEFGELQMAEESFLEARDVFTRLQIWRGAGLAVAKLANLATVRGDVPRARAYLEAFEAHLGVLDPMTAASIASCWADVHQSEGDRQASIDDLERAVACYERGELTREYLGARTKLGEALLSCRRIDEAAVQADRAAESESVARPLDRARLPRLRADIAAARGDLVESVRQLELVLASEHVLPFDEMYARLAYGKLALQTGNHGASEVEFRRAFELARDLEAPMAGANAAQGIASNLRALGNVSGAFEAACECVRLTEESGDRTLMTRILRYGDALSLATQLEDARAAGTLVSKLLPLLSEVEDLRQIEQSIRVVIDALVAVGDQLGARRLEMRLKSGGQR